MREKTALMRKRRQMTVDAQESPGANFAAGK